MTGQSDSSSRKQDLSAAKRALLEKRLGGQARRTSVMGIPRYPETESIPLSFAQERLWFLYQLNPQSPAYNMYNVVRFRGSVNINLLADCFQVLINRHAVFRTSFSTRDEQPIQKIASSVEFNIPLVELESTNQDAQLGEALELVKTEISRPFDLTCSPLLRALLIKQSDDEHILVLTIHHIIFDEWSNELFWKDFSAVYSALSKGETPDLPELEIQYSDFSIWQKRELDQVTSGQLDYWLGQLGGELPFIELPTDYPRPVNQEFRGALVWRELPARIYSQLNMLNQEIGTTMFMIMMAAYQVLLSRYSGQTDILVGTPIANRTRNETKSLVGFFLNTLVIRGDLGVDLSFLEFASQIRDKALSAYSNQDLPFEKLVDELHPSRDTSHNPIFQVMFVHQKSALDLIDLPDLSAEEVPVDINVSKFDMTLFAQENDGRLSIGLEYNTDLFDNETADRFLSCYQTLLDAIIENPQQKISRLEIIPVEERRKILRDWNDTAAGPVPVTCIHQLIEAQVESNGGGIAIADVDNKLSYVKLNKQANQLANYLQDQGVGPDLPVGIMLDRSNEMVLAILAVLKAGGAYLPLDPTFPGDRLAYMLDNARAPVLITVSDYAGNHPDFKGKMIVLDRDWSHITEEDDQNLNTSVSPENFAYVIYTSGSTGKPRGVAVTHHNLVQSTMARDFFYQDYPESFLLLSSFTFDSSIAGIFWTLCTGGKLVLPPARIEQDMNQLAEIIVSQQVTHTLCLPSLYMLLLEMVDDKKLISLQTVIVAGEACQPALVRSHFKILPAVGLFNEYGPTETTVWSTATQLGPEYADQPVPIGKPIPNTQNYILDRNSQPVPIGVAGELCIAGPGVTGGYLYDTQKTAEKFFEVSFDSEPPSRIYRTGDRVRYLPDGNIEFLGRIDQQVKIRGNRVELGEVESVMRGRPGVKDAVVNLQNQQLAAYVILEFPQEQSLEWRQYLSNYLAEYMIPSSFTTLKEFPRTPNGKVDRNALPDPPALDRHEKFIAPRNETENALAEIWVDILGKQQISATDDFFEIGGNSLLSIRVFGRIADRFNVKMPLSVLFTETTLERLAARIDREVEQESEWSLLVPIQPEGDKIPFFCIHGLTGDILWFRQLGRLMAPDQPFFGIQAQGLDGQSTAIDTIEQMAGKYIEEIKRVQPSGPYLLGGASLGGTVALEMAQKLKLNGEEVCLLVMFDHAPDVVADKLAVNRKFSAQVYHLLTNSIQWAKSVREMGSEQLLQRASRKARLSLKMFNGQSGRQESNSVDAADLLDYGSELPEFRQKMIETHWHAINNYLAAPYYQRVLLLQARSQPLLSTEKPEDTWVQLAAGELTVITVPGSHEGMFHEPHVRKLAQELRSQLDQIQAVPAG